MNWLPYALLAPSIYAGITFVDKYLLEGKAVDRSAMPIFSSAVALLAGIVLWTSARFPILPPSVGGIVAATGVLAAVAQVLYFRALATDLTTNINIFFQITPVMSFALGYLLLKETLTFERSLGFCVILIASSALAVGRKHGRLGVSKACGLILVCDFFWAASGVAIRFGFRAGSLVDVVIYESAGLALGGALIAFLVPHYRKAFRLQLRKTSGPTGCVIVLNEGLFVAEKAFTYYAFALGPVALVSVLEGTQSFFAVAYGWMLAKREPTTFHERTDWRAWAPKLALLACTLVGIRMIA